MADAAESVAHATGGWLRKEKAFPRVVYAVLGLLLLVTALLKLQGPADGALDQNTILFSPRLRFAVMEMEALLGLWLLSGWAKRTAWFFAVAFFLMVAGFSLYLGLMGQSSCGCFGRIHVSPWNAFALDVACLGMLGLCWSTFRHQQEEVNSRRLREAFSIAGWVIGILTICLVGILMVGGTRTGDFLAHARGDRITVEPPVTDMGSDVAGEVCRFTVRLHNHTDHAIRIVGGTTSCGCIATDDLPLSIPPSGSVPVAVSGKFRGTSGLFQQVFVFYSDDKEQDRILARFAGRVVDDRADKAKIAFKE
jgi:hypothetical protein